MFKKIVHFIRSQSALKNAAGLLALCFCLLGQAVEAQPTPFADPKFWIPDGPVNAILMTNDTIYFGGDFSYVGPRTGPTISFNQLDGKLQAYRLKLAA